MSGKNQDLSKGGAAVPVDSLYSTGSGTVPSSAVATLTDSLTFDGGTVVNTGKLELSSTDNGILLNRVTTAQMNAIASPNTNEIVYNTDLNALYRYDGANWVVLSAGYGLIEVIRDSDSGVPTYFADLQTAINTTYTASESSIVNVLSNIVVNTDIILSDNSNVSNSLIVDLNGFEIKNSQSDSTGIFKIAGNSPNLNVSVKNGRIVKENSTGGITIDVDGNKNRVSFENLYCLSDGGTTLDVSNTGYEMDLGGSIIENIGGNYSIFNTGTGIIKNFIAKGTANITYRENTGQLACDFITINSGSGDALFTRTSGLIQNFYAYANSGSTIVPSGGLPLLKSFYAYSETGRVIDATSNSYSAFDFILENGSSNTGYVIWSNGVGDRENNRGSIINNGTGDSVFSNDGTKMSYVDIYQNNSSYCVTARGNTSLYKYCDFTNAGGATLIDNQQSLGVTFKFCNFKSELDTASGHSVITQNDSFIFENCSFEVVNSSANCINATASRTTSIVNSIFKGATTPINANITVTASTDLSNGNRQI